MAPRFVYSKEIQAGGQWGKGLTLGGRSRDRQLCPPKGCTPNPLTAHFHPSSWAVSFQHSSWDFSLPDFPTGSSWLEMILLDVHIRHNGKYLSVPCYWKDGRSHQHSGTFSQSRSARDLGRGLRSLRLGQRLEIILSLKQIIERKQGNGRGRYIFILWFIITY